MKVRYFGTELGRIVGRIGDDFTELGSKDYWCEDLGLSFWIQDGTMTSIAIFPKYEDDGDTVIWPE